MSEKRSDGAVVELCWHASCEVNGKKRDGCGCECHEVKSLRAALDKAKAALREIATARGRLLKKDLDSAAITLLVIIAARALAELEGNHA